MITRYLVPVILCLHSCLANVEKTIFVAPPTVNIPQQHPTIEDLHLDVLTPDNWSLRTRLAADFPNDKALEGKISWFLLDNLTPSQRYEVRVCWPATVSFISSSPQPSHPSVFYIYVNRVRIATDILHARDLPAPNSMGHSRAHHLAGRVRLRPPATTTTALLWWRPATVPGDG